MVAVPGFIHARVEAGFIDTMGECTLVPHFAQSRSSPLPLGKYVLAGDFAVVVSGWVPSSLEFMVVFVAGAAGLVGARFGLVGFYHEYISGL